MPTVPDQIVPINTQAVRKPKGSLRNRPHHADLALVVHVPTAPSPIRRVVSSLHNSPVD